MPCIGAGVMECDVTTAPSLKPGVVNYLQGTPLSATSVTISSMESARYHPLQLSTSSTVETLGACHHRLFIEFWTYFLSCSSFSVVNRSTWSVHRLPLLLPRIFTYHFSSWTTVMWDLGSNPAPPYAQPALQELTLLLATYFPVSSLELDIML